MNQFQVISRNSEPRFEIEAEKPYQAYPFTFKDGSRGFWTFIGDNLIKRKFNHIWSRRMEDLTEANENA